MPRTTSIHFHNRDLVDTNDDASNDEKYVNYVDDEHDDNHDYDDHTDDDHDNNYDLDYDLSMKYR